MHFFKLILDHLKSALDSAKLQMEIAVVTTKFYKQFALHVQTASLTFCSVSPPHQAKSTFKLPIII